MHNMLQIAGTFCTDVAGASFKQNPGILNTGENVELLRVPTNNVHSNAIAVIDKNGNRAGWIPRALADYIAPDLDSKRLKIISCVVQDKKKITVNYHYV